MIKRYNGTRFILKQHAQDYDKFVGIMQNNSKCKYRFTTTYVAMQAAL